MTNSVDITLGSRDELYYLFSYEHYSQLELADVITHALNQTLQRDLFFGSWADVYYENQQYHVKITSPKDDVSAYEKLIPGFLNAGRKAFEIYREFEADILNMGQMHFLLPFGLAMARTRSIQLLHYPPNTTLDYMDYLYSKTSRRWECLLAQNIFPDTKFNSTQNTLLETVIDGVPLSAPGADSVGIGQFHNVFQPYREMMLMNLLRTDRDKQTMPAVAYGGPVHNALQGDYPQHIDGNAKIPSVHKIKLTADPAITPVLFANHPSEFFYFDTNTDEENLTIMRQDLISAGWQIEMSNDPTADPQVTLENMEKRWTDHFAIDPILEEQKLAFAAVEKYWKPNEASVRRGKEITRGAGSNSG